MQDKVFKMLDLGLSKHSGGLFCDKCRQICRGGIMSYSMYVYLKVPRCEILDPFFFTPINPIWVGDLRTGEQKNFFRRLRQIFVILRFLRMLSVR